MGLLSVLAASLVGHPRARLAAPRRDGRPPHHVFRRRRSGYERHRRLGELVRDLIGHATHLEIVEDRGCPIRALTLV
jgi:hypothetical protein